MEINPKLVKGLSGAELHVTAMDQHFRNLQKYVIFKPYLTFGQFTDHGKMSLVLNPPNIDLI
jgi:hypothetical protein